MTTESSNGCWQVVELPPDADPAKPASSSESTEWARDQMADIDRKVQEAMAERDRRREAFRATLLEQSQNQPAVVHVLCLIEKALTQIEPPAGRASGVWAEPKLEPALERWAAQMLTAEVYGLTSDLLCDIGLVLEVMTKPPTDSLN